MCPPKDTVAAKLNAISQRGGKMDFYDLYELLKTKPLEELVGHCKERFDQDNSVPLLKSLNLLGCRKKGGPHQILKGTSNNSFASKFS